MTHAISPLFCTRCAETVCRPPGRKRAKCDPFRHGVAQSAKAPISSTDNDSAAGHDTDCDRNIRRSHSERPRTVGANKSRSSSHLDCCRSRRTKSLAPTSGWIQRRFPQARAGQRRKSFAYDSPDVLTTHRKGGPCLSTPNRRRRSSARGRNASKGGGTRAHGAPQVDRGEELLARFRAIAEHAQHAAGDHRRVVLQNASSRHAAVGAFDYNGHAVRLENVVESIGDFSGHSFLDLQSPGIDVHQPSKL